MSAFSRDGKRLAAVGHDADHTIVVYATRGEWADGARVASGAGGRAKVLCALFVGEAHFPLMLGGSRHVEFVEQSGRARSRASAASSASAPRSSRCSAASPSTAAAARR